MGGLYRPRRQYRPPGPTARVAEPTGESHCTELRGGIALIDRVGSVGSSAPVGAVPAAPRIAPGIPPARTRDSAAFESAGLKARARLAGPHSMTERLQRVLSFVDSADGALASVGELLDRGRAGIASGQSIDAVLEAIDSAASGPRWEGDPVLREGLSLSAGASVFDVRPVSTEHLGTVIALGRTHRLTDLRSGGSLDAAAYQSGALRSVDAAAGEVGGLRNRLSDFRAFAIEPAQHDALRDLRRALDTGPSSLPDAETASLGVRKRLSGSLALAGAEALSVLSLLS